MSDFSLNLHCLVHLPFQLYFQVCDQQTLYLLEYLAFILKLVSYIILKELEGHLVNSCWNNLCWQPLRPFWKASEGRCFPPCCSNTFVRWHYWSQTQQEVSHPALLVWICSSKKPLIETTIKTVLTIKTVQTVFCWSRHYSASRSPPGKWGKDDGNLRRANGRHN